MTKAFHDFLEQGHTECTGPLCPVSSNRLLDTHRALEHGDQRGQQGPTSSQVQCLEGETHVQAWGRGKILRFGFALVDGSWQRGG